MAKILAKSSTHNEDDDEEDLEALRLAALRSIGKKQVLLPPPPTAVFKPHNGNPNLIAIIPEGAPVELPGRQKLPLNQKLINTRQNFFRHPKPRPQALKVLPQVQLESKPTTTPQETNVVNEKEEVSTKFSRYEDTESESEDESETDKKESDESSDESEDVLAIEDEDDSLEALMAQMEHEIEAGIDLDTTKKEKKKKGNKTKEKEAKVKTDVKPADSVKPETKTAIVEPTIIDRGENDSIKSVDKKNSECSGLLVMSKSSVNNSVNENCVKNEVPTAPLRKKSNSPVRKLSVAPLQTVPVLYNSPERERQKSITPPRIAARTTPSPKRDRRRSVSPPRNASHYSRAPISPKRDLSPINRIERSRSPVKRKSFSPRRSPISRAHSPPRRKSPWKYSPDRRSPPNRSPRNYYNSNKSPSPYYMSREREYSTLRRSRTPIRRKSYSPRNVDIPPKYSKRRSMSPWSPSRRSKSPPRYRSRSPIHRRSLSPRNRKYVKPKYVSPLRSSPKRRSPSLSPMRSPRRRGISPRRLASPKRDVKYVSPKRDLKYGSPKRDIKYASPKRDMKYRRSSPSPKRRSPPPYKRVSPPYNSKQRQRSISPRRRVSPVPDKEMRSRMNDRSRTVSLSLSPSPPRDSKEFARRYAANSPSRNSKAPTESMNNQRGRMRRDHSPEIKSNAGDKEKKKANKTSDREVGRLWDRKADDRRKERAEKRDKDAKKAKGHSKVKNQKSDEPKEEDSSLKVTNNPIFEARRKKFESKAVVEPAKKKIYLVNKKSVMDEEREEFEKKKDTEEKQVIENSVQTEADLFSGHEEIDEIDNFLNEDVLDLSAEVWSSDDDLFPKSRKKSPAKPVTKVKSSLKHKTEKSSAKEKGERRKSKASASPSAANKVSKRKKSKAKSPKVQKSEKEKERDESDLRAELSRRREERLTKAGSLHEKLPARLLQSAFESALGNLKAKKEIKSQKMEKEVTNKETVSPPPPPKERGDGRRVLVLKRQAPVRMQSAHINVTFPKDAASDSDCSYSSSSSDERYAKRKLPVYMRLGTVQPRKGTGGRKVKLRSRRSQV